MSNVGRGRVLVVAPARARGRSRPRRPARCRATPAPTAATRPAPSEPSVTGTGVEGARQSHQSRRLSAAVTSSTTTSPAAGHGVGELLQLEAGLARGEREAGGAHAGHPDGYDRRVARPVTLRDLVAELVAIDSVNPDLVPGRRRRAGDRPLHRRLARGRRRGGAHRRGRARPRERDRRGARARRRPLAAAQRAHRHGRARGLRAAARAARRGRSPLRARQLRHEGRHGRGAVGVRARRRGSSSPATSTVAAVCDEEFASIGTQAVAEQAARPTPRS